MTKFHTFMVSLLLPTLVWTQITQTQSLNLGKKENSKLVHQSTRTASTQQFQSSELFSTVPNDMTSVATNGQSSGAVRTGSPFENVKNKREIVSKRNDFSKTYLNDDGSFTTLISAGPIHYQKNGQFLDIDTQIKNNPSTIYSKVNSTNIFESHFGATSHTGLKNKTSEGELIEFQNTQMYWESNGQTLNQRNSSNVNVTTENNRAYYKNIYGQISAEFIVSPAERKLNYIIPNKQDLGQIPANADFLVFSEDLILPFGWSWSQNEKGVFIKDAIGKEIYLYHNPYSFDTSGQTETMGNSIYEIVQLGNTLRIKTKVKASWLLSSQRQFPVVVDPTVTVYPNNYVYFMVSVNSDGSEAGIGFRGNFGRTENALLAQSHIRFNTSAVPTGITVNSAVGYINIESRKNNAPWTREWQWYNSLVPTHYGQMVLYNSATDALSATSAVTGTGWRNISLSSPAGTNYIKSSIDNNFEPFVALAIKTSGTYNNGEIFNAYDYNTSDRPYLQIDYNNGNCATPSNPTISNITKTSATFNWTESNPAAAAGYEIYMNTTGMLPTPSTTGQFTVPAGVTTYTRTGLTNNSVNFAWVRSRCSTSLKSDWIRIGYFNTLPQDDCFQGDGQIMGWIVGALNVPASGSDRVADDFIVPSGKSFTLKQITVEVISATDVNQATIKIRSNQSNTPGGILNTYTLAPSKFNKYSTFNGMDVYHLTFNLPTSYVTYSTGRYWLDVSMSNTGGTDVFWRVTNNGSNGNLAQTSNNGGSSWTENSNNYHAMFFVAGVCDDVAACDPITASADKPAVCSGETVNLSVSSTDPSYTYNWYSDWDNDTQSGTFIGTGPSVAVQAGTSQLYGVIGTKTGCSVSDQIDIQNLDRNWISTSNTNWDNASNWSGGSVPDQNSCVRIPSTTVIPVIETSTLANGKNLIIDNGGGLRIQKDAALTLVDFVQNNSASDSFVIESGGNLVQINDDAVNTGEINVERLFTLSPSRIQYNFVISPVEGQKIKQIYAGNPMVIYYNENTNYFYNAGQGDYIAGRGLAIKEPSAGAVPASTVTAEFTGKPFNGTLSFPIAYTTNNPTAGDEHGVNLVGNPYPSNLDLVQLYQGNSSKITPNFYFWDNRGNTETTQQGSEYDQSNYASFNAAAGPEGTGVAALGASGAARIPDRNMTVGTAVHLNALPTANGQTVDFKNEYRTTAAGKDFYGKPTETSADRYWLTLTSPDQLQSMAAVVYFENGNNDLWLDDTESFDASDDIYSMIDQDKLSIQTKNIFEDSDTIKLGVNIFKTGTYTISLHKSEGVFEDGQDIYLVDRQTGLTRSLKQGVYKFVVRPGQYTNRFLIVYKTKINKDYSKEDIIFENKVDIIKQDEQIKINSSIDKLTEVELFNLTGRSLYKKTDLNSNEHSIHAGSFENQIIFINVKTEKGVFVRKKFVNQ